MNTSNVQSFDPKNLQQAPNITMTEAAVEHFRKQLEHSDASSVRLFIQESGCSGYMYRIELVESPEDGDIKLQMATDVTLCVEQSALAILQGTEIDYKKDGLNKLVKFNNPNVTAECGCGESFVVEND